MKSAILQYNSSIVVTCLFLVQIHLIWSLNDLIEKQAFSSIFFSSYPEFRLIKLLSELLTEIPLPSHSLTLEMTESLLIENSSRSNNALEKFRELGVNLSIDDFGTGYSSLSYLKQFPMDILKIDKSFIHDITQDKDDAILTTAIIDLAHNFNLKFIAEGVETIRQLNFLKQNGCDMIQGYYYSQPLPADDFYHYCLKQNRQQNSIKPSNGT